MTGDDLIRCVDALNALGSAAWKHAGDDPYSMAMDATARHQSEADYNAIRALPAIEPAPAWQPIETAPKDGRWMLGAWINADDGCGYVTATVRYEGGADWREKIGMGCGGPCSCPTHWQPLPEPPK